MRSTSIIIAFVIASAALCPWELAEGDPPVFRDGVVLKFPESTNTHDLAVFAWGIIMRPHQLDCQERAESHSFAIDPAEARSLKAVVLSRHHQIVLLSVPSIGRKGPQSVEVALKPLRSVRLSGKVTFPPGIDGSHFHLRADYLWIEGMDYLGYADGPPPNFTAAEAALKPDGSFELEVPDFWNDSTLGYSEDKGFFHLDLFPVSGKYSLDDAKQVEGRDGWKVQVAARYEFQNLRAAVLPAAVDGAAKPSE